MNKLLLLFGAAALVGGCATGRAEWLAQKSSATLGVVPEAAEAAALYQAFRRRQPCPEQAHCGAFRPIPVDQVTCNASSADQAICRLLVRTSESDAVQYSCEGMYSREAGQWVMLELIRGCRLVPWPLPSRRTIERLERRERLDEIIRTVGVVDTASMNRNSRVRVRGVSCRALPDGSATCRYQADHCLPDERDTDADGWCGRETRLIRPSPALPLDLAIDGWLIFRPSDES